MSTPMTRGEETIEAGAAAQVEHALARLQRGDGLRIAATEAEVGACRHGGGFFGAVADAARQQFGDGLIGGCAAATGRCGSRRAAAAGLCRRWRGITGARDCAVGVADLLADVVVGCHRVLRDLPGHCGGPLSLSRAAAHPSPACGGGAGGEGSLQAETLVENSSHGFQQQD